MPDERRADHLFLLTGGNPLPNAVAGLTLVEPSGQITLVHTDETQSTKDRLVNWLRREYEDRGGIDLTPLKVDSSDAHDIYTKVCDQIKQHREVLKRVGLNYTGGTKAMAVHAYRAVREESAGDPVFSYLDARTLRMLFDPSDAAHPGGKGYEYLGRKPKLKLEHLVNLHDWRLRENEEPAEKPLMLNTADALLEMNTIRQQDEREAAIQEWLGWKSNWYNVWKKHQLTPWDRDAGKAESSKLLRHEVPLPSGNEHLGRIAEALRADLGDAAQGGSFTIGEAAKSAGFYWTRAEEEVAATDFCRWLDGSWLESKVLKALKDLKDEHDLHRPCMGFCLEEREEGSGRTFFEFDVAALRGHQLYGFSCSSSNKGGELKRKLFELYTRTRQFGGDEACAALVAPYHNPEGLQREMRRDLGSERIRVFGRESLKDLSKSISNWIDTQTGRP